MRSLKGFVVEPVLLDALSGDFTPQSDSGNKHTLGRVVIATLLKGAEAYDASPFPRYIYTYTPSWTKVESEIVGIHAGPVVLKRLQLRGEAGETFDIASSTNTNMEPSLSLEIDGTQILVADQELCYSAAVRDTVARHAQDFFDRVSPS
ncbi:MAG TPA: hypothetical protein VL989_02045 [Candidatus Sulfotelmatobacter sp.]|nr:hypothetical protein [Candidatus Sulfotelmatobacter sp.]